MKNPGVPPEWTTPVYPRPTLAEQAHSLERCSGGEAVDEVEAPVLQGTIPVYPRPTLAEQAHSLGGGGGGEAADEVDTGVPSDGTAPMHPGPTPGWCKRTHWKEAVGEKLSIRSSACCAMCSESFSAFPATCTPHRTAKPGQEQMSLACLWHTVV